MDQFEATEEVDQARLKCLQMWTEKRLETAITTVPGKDRDLYRLLCEPRLYFIVTPTPVFIPLTDESPLIRLKR